MKKIFYSMLALIALSACKQEDPAAVAPQTTNPQIILAPKATSDVTEVIAEPGAHILDVNFGFAAIGGTTYFDRDVDIMFEGSTHTLDIESGGANYINVGAYAFPYVIPTPSGDVPFSGITQVLDIDVSELDYSYSIANRPIDLVVIKGKTAPLQVNTVVYGNIPSDNDTKIQFVMDWSGWDAGVDLDCRILSSSNLSIDTGYSVSRYEEVEISNTASDDTYTFTIRPWAGSGVVPVKIFVKHPDGTLEIIDYSITITGGYWTQEVAVLSIEKVGNVYTVTQI